VRILICATIEKSRVEKDFTREDILLTTGDGDDDGDDVTTVSADERDDLRGGMTSCDSVTRAADAAAMTQSRQPGSGRRMLLVRRRLIICREHLKTCRICVIDYLRLIIFLNVIAPRPVMCSFMLVCQ